MIINNGILGEKSPKFFYENARFSPQATIQIDKILFFSKFDCVRSFFCTFNCVISGEKHLSKQILDMMHHLVPMKKGGTTWCHLCFLLWCVDYFGHTCIFSLLTCLCLLATFWKCSHLCVLLSRDFFSLSLFYVVLEHRFNLYHKSCSG